MIIRVRRGQEPVRTGTTPFLQHHLSRKSARAYLFPQSVKFITFAAAPLVLTPFVRNHVSLTHMATGRLRRDDVHLHAVLRAPLSPPME